MCDLDLPVLATDSRRLEVLVDGLPLFGWCQWAVDTTLVCAMHCDGTPHNGAANKDGVVLEAARRRKESSPQTGALGTGPVWWLAVEIGGCWSPETTSFLAQLALAKSRQETPLLQKRAWAGTLATKAVTTSLLKLKLRGSDGDPFLFWETIVTMVWCE